LVFCALSLVALSFFAKQNGSELCCRLGFRTVLKAVVQGGRDMERVREEGQRGSLGSGPKGSSMLFKQGSTTQLHAREDTLIWSCSAR